MKNESTGLFVALAAAASAAFLAHRVIGRRETLILTTEAYLKPDAIEALKSSFKGTRFRGLLLPHSVKVSHVLRKT